VLIIDEISMLSGELFENLEAAARKVRKNPAPFGGIQLIACGDFFQVRTRVVFASKRPAPQPQIYCRRPECFRGSYLSLFSYLPFETVILL
jgi:hypothetical protein